MKTLIRYLVLFVGIILFTVTPNGLAAQDKKPLINKNIEIFTFKSQGISHNAKIFIPESYDNTKKYHAIVLIDFTEQHFKIAKDEYEQVLAAVSEIDGLQALVVTLQQHLDVDATPDSFEKYSKLFRDMAAYVAANYSTTHSKTFIGRGSESGIVIMSMLKQKDENATFDNFIATDPSGKYSSVIIDLLKQNNFPFKKKPLKLHFSFSSSNDQIKCAEIIRLFKSANYPWLRFKSKIYANNDYENTYKESFAEGLRFVFEE